MHRIRRNWAAISILLTIAFGGCSKTQRISVLADRWEIGQHKTCTFLVPTNIVCDAPDAPVTHWDADNMRNETSKSIVVERGDYNLEKRVNSVRESLRKAITDLFGTDRQAFPALQEAGLVARIAEVVVSRLPAPSHGHLSHYSILTWKVKEGLPYATAYHSPSAPIMKYTSCW